MSNRPEQIFKVNMSPILKASVQWVRVLIEEGGGVLRHGMERFGGKVLSSPHFSISCIRGTQLLLVGQMEGEIRKKNGAVHHFTPNVNKQMMVTCRFRGSLPGCIHRDKSNLGHGYVYKIVKSIYFTLCSVLAIGNVKFRTSDI